MYLRNSQLIFLAIPVDLDSKTYLNSLELLRMVHRIKDYRGRIIFIITKTDKEECFVSYRELEKLRKKQGGLEILYTSAKTGFGCKELCEYVRGVAFTKRCRQPVKVVDKSKCTLQ